ncbi:curli fiber surface-exposed nucleator CsgB [Salinisphaera shabanensis T35B1]|uniref:hypothetical protein n=1 Tax=Salinisphaera shabanensis TaxID=180542 RepID=UPI003342B3C9
MCNSTLLKISKSYSKLALVTRSATSLALALIFSSSVTAEDAISNFENGGDLSRQQLKTVIDSSALRPSAEAWRNNTSVIAQIGDDNRASVTQTRDTAEFAFGNYANIYQNGGNNEANIIQSGGNNIGLIGQIGRDHKATIEQDGNRFEAQINQIGIKSNIGISQSGSGLRSISVNQRTTSGSATPVTIRTY